MIRRIIFILCWTWIIFCIVALAIGQLVPYRFSQEVYAENFYGIIWLTLPVAIILTLVGSEKYLKVKPFIFILAIIAFVVGRIFILRGKICGDKEELVFVSKINPEEKIIKRYADCGAYDSDRPVIHFYKVKRVNKYLIYCPKVDTAKLDRDQWISYGR